MSISISAGCTRQTKQVSSSTHQLLAAPHICDFCCACHLTLQSPLRTSLPGKRLGQGDPHNHTLHSTNKYSTQDGTRSRVPCIHTPARGCILEDPRPERGLRPSFSLLSTTSAPPPPPPEKPSTHAIAGDATPRRRSSAAQPARTARAAAAPRPRVSLPPVIRLDNAPQRAGAARRCSAPTRGCPAVAPRS